MLNKLVKLKGGSGGGTSAEAGVELLQRRRGSLECVQGWGWALMGKVSHFSPLWLTCNYFSC